MPTGAGTLNQILRSIPGENNWGYSNLRTGRLDRDAACARCCQLRLSPRQPQRQLRSAAEVKLAVDMMQVHLHGAFGHMEFAADFLVAQTLRYVAGNISFA